MLAAVGVPGVEQTGVVELPVERGSEWFDVRLTSGPANAISLTARLSMAA